MPDDRCPYWAEYLRARAVNAEPWESNAQARYLADSAFATTTASASASMTKSAPKSISCGYYVQSRDDVVRVSALMDIRAEEENRVVKNSIYQSKPPRYDMKTDLMGGMHEQ